LTDEESGAHAGLLAEYRALEEEYSGQDEYPEEIDARLGQLEMAMETLEQRPLIFDPAEVIHAGVFVTLDRDGTLPCTSSDLPASEAVTVQRLAARPVFPLKTGQESGHNAEFWNAYIQHKTMILIL
jgi:hypothetical protein